MSGYHTCRERRVLFIQTITGIESVLRLHFNVISLPFIVDIVFVLMFWFLKLHKSIEYRSTNVKKRLLT